VQKPIANRVAGPRNQLTPIRMKRKGNVRDDRHGHAGLDPQPPGGRALAPDSNTGVVFRALTARRAAGLADRHTNTVFATTARGTSAQGVGVSGRFPTFRGRVQDDAGALTDFSNETVRGACSCGRRGGLSTPADLADLSSGPEDLSASSPP